MPQHGPAAGLPGIDVLPLEKFLGSGTNGSKPRDMRLQERQRDGKRFGLPRIQGFLPHSRPENRLLASRMAAAEVRWAPLANAIGPDAGNLRVAEPFRADYSGLLKSARDRVAQSYEGRAPGVAYE